MGKTNFSFGLKLGKGQPVTLDSSLGRGEQEEIHIRIWGVSCCCKFLHCCRNLPAEFQMSRLNHRLDVIKDEKRTGVILQR